MLKWTKPMTTKSGITLSAAYWHLHTLNINDVQKKAVLRYSVYQDADSYADPEVRPLPPRDVGFPRKIELVDGKDYIVNSVTYSDVFTNYVIPGLSTANLINYLKIFIADAIGGTGLVWD